MSKKGENKKLKAKNAPKTRKIKRKEFVWTVKAIAGAHPAKESIPLGILLRDYIKIVDDLKEAKKILINKHVKVDSKIRKDYRFGVGLFDTITIEKQKLYYRLVLDKKNRLVLKKFKEELKDKICKVTKKVAYKNDVQITTNDGRTFLNKETSVGDSIKISLPEGKIISVIKLGENARAYMTRGSHCSEIGVIQEIIPSSAKREKLVKIAQDSIVFETIAKNIIVVDKEFDLK